MKKTFLIAIGATILFGGQYALGSGSKHLEGAAHNSHMAEQATPSSGGQAAFAEIATIVAELESDSSTEWSNVDIEALREHLIDMNNVILAASVQSTPIENGVEFKVTGSSNSVVQSIQNMTSAHGTMMPSEGLTWTVELLEKGSLVVVTADNEGGAEKIRALGFHGLLTLGNHHSEHHRMVARGLSPH